MANEVIPLHMGTQPTSHTHAECEALIEQLEALLSQRSDVVSLIEQLIPYLEHLPAHEPIVTTLMPFFHFCREQPQIGFIVACLAGMAATTDGECTEKLA